MKATKQEVTIYELNGIEVNVAIMAHLKVVTKIENPHDLAVSIEHGVDGNAIVTITRKLKTEKE